MKVAVLAPAATVTVAGTVSRALLLLSATVAAALTVLESVTVQLEVAAGPKLDGAQMSTLTMGAETSEMEADCEPPFRDAVSTAVWSVGMVPAVALKVALVAAAATDTPAGTDSRALLLVSATVTPPAGAGFDRVTVQVDTTPEFSVTGAHESVAGTADEPSRIESDCELLFKEAVTFADWSEGIVPAVALNVAVVKPEATTTAAGTVSSGLLLLSTTESPPAPAGFDSVTVQVDEAPDPRLVGVQLKRFTTVGATSEIPADWLVLFTEAVTETV